MTGIKMCTLERFSVKPRGWIQTYFQKMLNGLTGHLHELFYPFNTDCWMQKSFQDGGMEGWWPYEQAAYWLDGYVKCAYFAGDKRHFEKAKGMIDSALDVVDESGFVGASDLKTKGQGNQWVHAVFFRAVLFLYDITGDKSYLERVAKHYLSDTSDYATWRETVNVENMLVCYFKGGDKRLKTLAVQAYEKHCDSSENKETKLSDYERGGAIDLHGVTYNEMLKIPLLLYVATGEERYLRGAKKGLARIRKYHMLPTGIMHSASEFFGDTKATSCVETCDLTDHVWTLGYFGQVTGESEYFDAIEKIAYNLAPSVVDKNFTCMQYYSSLNDVISTRTSNHSGSFTQTPRTAYQSNHYPECCTGNLNRSMPNFLYRSLMKTQEGYAFNFYLPCEYRVDNKTFDVRTEYPYKENVQIYYTGEKTHMQLRLRIPAWCKGFSYTCKQTARVEKGWLIVDGEFETGDEVCLRLPSEVTTEQTDEGIAVWKAPLLYTLKIDARVEIDEQEPRQTKEYPAYNVTPTSAWQIALEKELFEKTVKLCEGKTGDLLCSGYTLTAQGYLMHGVDFLRPHTSEVFVSEYDKVELVKLRKMGQVIYEGDLTFTPDNRELTPSGFTQTQITLVPYAEAGLRWTVFPDVKNYKK